MRKPVFRVSDQALHKLGCTATEDIARGSKFRIYKEEGLYYICNVNEGADQLHCYRTSDLRLCIRICKKLFFS